MFRLNDIKKAFDGLIGWRQGCGREIDAELTASASGMMYQDAHPMLTLDNVAAVMPDGYEGKYPCWDIERTYEDGAVVRYQGRVYMAEDPIYGLSPDTDGSGWAEYWPLSDYLREITDGAIARVIQKFTTTKQTERETTSIVKSEALVAAPNRTKATIMPSGKLVGFSFTTMGGVGVSVKVDKIGLQMSGATGKVKVYLFSASEFEPIREMEVDIAKATAGFYWIETEDLYLKRNKTYYVCYHQDDLPQYMRAVNANRDWSRRPCGTCNQGNPRLWDSISKYVKIRPFMAVTAGDWIENPMLPEIEDMSFEPTYSYGFNFVVQVGCDITDFVVEQKLAFANALQLEVASDVLRRIALNPNVRVNRNQMNASKAELLYEIDGDTQGTRPTGINAMLRAAYKGIELDTKGMDKACMACRNRGIRYTQV